MRLFSSLYSIYTLYTSYNIQHLDKWNVISTNNDIIMSITANQMKSTKKHFYTDFYAHIYYTIQGNKNYAMQASGIRCSEIIRINSAAE